VTDFLLPILHIRKILVSLTGLVRDDTFQLVLFEDRMKKLALEKALEKGTSTSRT
jgi:DNA polymerase IV